MHHKCIILFKCIFLNICQKKSNLIVESQYSKWLCWRIKYDDMRSKGRKCTYTAANAPRPLYINCIYHCKCRTARLKTDRRHLKRKSRNLETKMNATMLSALNIQFLVVSIAEILEGGLLTITDVFAAEVTKICVKWHCVCVSQVACLMGIVLISFGAEAAPSKHPQKKGNGHHRSSEELDPSSSSSSSYRLILDSEFKAAKPIQSINNDSISPWTYT